MVELTLQDAVAVQEQRFPWGRWCVIGPTLVASGVVLPLLEITDFRPEFVATRRGPDLPPPGYAWWNGDYVPQSHPYVLPFFLHNLLIQTRNFGWVTSNRRWAAYQSERCAVLALREAAWLAVGGKPWWN